MQIMVVFVTATVRTKLQYSSRLFSICFAISDIGIRAKLTKLIVECFQKHQIKEYPASQHYQVHIQPPQRSIYNHQRSNGLGTC